VRTPACPAALLGVILLCGACGSGGDDPQASQDAAPRADAPASSDGSAPAGEAVIGAFLVELTPPAGGAAGRTSLSGKVSDGPTPATVVLDLVKETGGCRLLSPRAPFCDPACSGSDLCVGDNRCAAYPKSQDLGPVEVRGLGSAPITMAFVVNSYEVFGDLNLPFPPAPEGGEVKVIVKGGRYGAFTLATQAVAPLAWSDTLILDRNKAIALTWTAPGMPAVGRMEVKVEISHHGGSKGEIDCSLPDTGSGQVPAELVTKLIDFGVAGFPTVTLTRVATGTASIAPGQVRLQVLSSIKREVMVAGYTSCDETNPCPGGKTCSDKKTCI
jgi:hypothetical protein